MYVSPNINHRRARRLSDSTGISLTADLGKYLGVPLLQSILSKLHFNPIVEKVQRRLAGWKANVLNLAGRATLVQLVTSTIPNYTMQTMEISVSVCDNLDRINRNFLRGDTDSTKKIHLVNWTTVCKSKIGVDLISGKLETKTWHS